MSQTKPHKYGQVNIKSGNPQIWAQIDYPTERCPLYRTRLMVNTTQAGYYVATKPIDENSARFSAIALYNAANLLNKLNSEEIILPDFDGETKLAELCKLSNLFD